jgi:hypothetical protein
VLVLADEAVIRNDWGGVDCCCWCWQVKGGCCVIEGWVYAVMANVVLVLAGEAWRCHRWLGTCRVAIYVTAGACRVERDW